MPTPLNVLDQVRQFIKKDELALAIDLLSQLHLCSLRLKRK